MLGLVASLQHQLPVLSLALRARRSRARDCALGAELSQDELLHVVHRALHHAADLGEVHPGHLEPKNDGQKSLENQCRSFSARTMETYRREDAVNKNARVLLMFDKVDPLCHNPGIPR